MSTVNHSVQVEFGANVAPLSAGAKQAAGEVGAFGDATRSLGDISSQIANSMSAAWSGIGAAFKGIGADITSGLVDQGVSSMGIFGQVGADVAEQVSSKLASLPPVLREATQAFAGFALVIGAGIASKKIADGFAESVEGTMDLARALGTSTNEASVMQAALEDVGATEGEYTGAAKGLSRQLKENEEAMQAMGLKTRDAQGNLRPLNDLTLEALESLNGYKEGTDRALAGQVLFGRGIDGSSRLLLLNKEGVEENRAAVAELGLEVGSRATTAWANYDKAADRAGLMMKSFGRSIAEAVMPMATQLTEWFNNIAPAAIRVTRGAVGGISTAFLGLANGAVIVWETIKAMVSTVAEPLISLGSALGKIASGDFAGATNEMMNWPAKVGAAWGGAMDNIIAKSQQTRARIAGIWAWTSGPDSAPGDSGGAPGTETAPRGKGKGKEGAKGKASKSDDEKSMMSVFEAELEAARRAATEKDAIHGMQKSAELKFWEDIKATRTMSSKDETAVAKKVAHTRIEILKEEAQKRGELAKIGIEGLKTQALAEVDLAEEAARMQLAVGEITDAQMLSKQREFEQQRYAIRMEAFQQQEAMLDPALDVTKIAQLHAQIEQEEQRHQGELAKIRTGTAKLSASEQYSVWDDLTNRMSSLWDQGVQAMMNGTLTWTGAFRAAAMQIGGVMGNLTKNMIKDWWKAETTKTGATTLGTAQRLAVESWAAIKSTAIWAAAGIKNIMISAWQAMAGAYAAIAGIPYVGPVLAPITAGIVFAGVAGLVRNVASAEGGYDIPAGVNPLTQLHEREMVLPAQHADTIRALGENGSAGAGGGDTFIINNHTVDSRGTKAFFLDNQAGLAAALVAARRNGHLPGKV